MQLVDDDGSLVFADAFGLTRIDAKGKVKHMEKVCGTPRTPLSVGGAPRVVHVHGPQTFASKLLDLTTLKPAAQVESSVGAVLPDGKRLQAASLFDVDGQALGPLPDFTALPVAPVKLDGDDPPRCHVDARQRRGWLALWTSTEPGLLGVYDANGKQPKPRWQVPVRARAEAVVDFWPSADGLVLIAWQIQRAQATVVRLDRTGAPKERATLSTIVMPVVDGARVITQPDEDNVVSRSLTGEGTSTFHLDVITKAARARARDKGVKQAPENRGACQLIAGQGRTLVVPWHGETVLDLDLCVERDRKLSATHQPLRRWLATWMKSHREERAACGLSHLTRAELGAGGRVALDFWFTLGTQPMRDRAKAMVAQATSDLLAAGYRPSSYCVDG